MAPASPSGSKSPGQLRKEQRKDWCRLDYLLKSAPPRLFRLTEQLVYPVSTKCRLLFLVPPPELQPRRIYLLPELESLKLDDYHRLITRRAATIGLDLDAPVGVDQQGLDLAWRLDDLEYEFRLKEYDQRYCTLRSTLTGHLHFIGWHLAAELGLTRRMGRASPIVASLPYKWGTFLYYKLCMRWAAEDAAC